ncbi:uncharacterized protein LOC120155894 [Hibiscus syriacus]|uniref:uncharacterized protein LOC120155894 n=1 Tax=Hibiscus syriacus TaxID=106335 RepID=UPI0019212A0F|nr:uncharacterized protein LOC120155894 [Hibiscus syriacus]
MSGDALTDWRGLFVAGIDHELEFFLSEVVEGSSVVKLPIEVFEEGIQDWKHALVGQFIGLAPSFSSIQNIVTLLWSKVSLVKVSIAGPNLYVFSFSNSNARDWVLDGGPWHVQHKPMLLRKWEPNLKELHFDFCFMPIWIHLFNVPLELFSKRGLSYIESVVGKPLHMDSVIVARDRLEYARVCVEVPAGSIIQDYIDVVLCDGSMARVRVSVPWMPTSCTDCRRFGHSVKFCPRGNGKKTEQVWRIKRNVNDVQQIVFSVVDKAMDNVIVDISSGTSNVICSGEKLPAPVTSQVELVADASVGTNSAAISTLDGNCLAIVFDDKMDMVKQAEQQPLVKRGKGRPSKEGRVIGESRNKFEVLCAIDPEKLLESTAIDSGRKHRGSSLGVAKGFNSSFKQAKVLNWATRNQVSILCLLETRVKEINYAAILLNKFSDWHYCFYGSNDSSIRKHLWDQLNSLEALVGSKAWLIGGDFNAILNVEESSAPVNSSTLADIFDFQNCVEGLGLFDHPFTGPLFTWTNKQQDAFLARKLDRALVNSNWIDVFPASDVEFQAPRVSDHFPTLVWLHKDIPAVMPKPFKLFNFWAKHPNFMAIVRESWQAPVTANLLQTLYLKLKRLKRSLKKLNRSCYGDIFGKKKNNTIRVLFNQRGERLDTFEAMSNEVVGFFVNQLGVADPKVKDSDVNTIKELLGYSLPRCAAENLCKDVSDAEIKEALWGQGNNKSPAPDGYNSFFFKRTWAVVGEDFLTAIRILVDRLSSVFPGMISMNQTTFVKGRSIVDNTLLAQEIVRGYSRKNMSPRCALKIDLQKAFDSLNWEFIGVIIGARGVRQGDPLSSYIFVLAMNVFSNLLNMAALNGVFGYHPKCKRIGLTHICFADDLLIFCKGAIDSVMGSSLIRDFTGFRLGALLVRYLGVPLVTRKLAVKDCQALIDKLRAKLASWENKHLSFTVRQLILPHAIIRKVEQLCSCFFWKGSDVPANGARLIKKLLANEGSLWMAWIHSYVIINADFWQMAVPANASWNFKHLLEIIYEIAHLFTGQVCHLSTRQVLDDLRATGPKVPWHHLIWFSGCIPKFSIMTLMAMLNILPTRVRLVHMGLSIETDKCLMCGTMTKTREHLFIECSFAKELWGSVLGLCGINRGVSSWDSELAWAVCFFKGKSLIVRILNLAWTGNIYGIWMERNSKLFGKRNRTKDDVLDDIKQVIRIRL